MCSGKWEGGSIRVAAPRRPGPISEGRLTSTLSHCLMDLCPGLAPRPQRRLWRTNSLPLLSDFMGSPKASEERQRSDGLLGKVRQPRAKTSKYRGVANHPKTERMGRKELDSSFLLHVFFNFLGPLLSTQTRAVRLLRAGSVQRVTTSRPPSPMTR